MKLMKLFVLTSALLFSVQAVAVGPMSKGEVRDGTLVCYDKKQKDISAHADGSDGHDKRSVDNVSAK